MSHLVEDLRRILEKPGRKAVTLPTIRKELLINKELSEGQLLDEMIIKLKGEIVELDRYVPFPGGRHYLYTTKKHYAEVMSFWDKFRCVCNGRMW